MYLRNFYIITLVCLSLMIQCGCNAQIESSQNSHQQSQSELKNKLLASTPDPSSISACQAFNFKYVIVSEYPVTETSKRIEVFLEKSSFSESNLEQLFRSISARNKVVKSLTVVVWTEWDQLPVNLSEDCPGLGGSGRSTGDSPAYLKATFKRRNANEYFTYTPKEGDPSTKQVILNKN